MGCWGGFTPNLQFSVGLPREEKCLLVPSETVISLAVNHLPNDREKENALRPF